MTFQETPNNHKNLGEQQIWRAETFQFQNLLKGYSY